MDKKKYSTHKEKKRALHPLKVGGKLFLNPLNSHSQHQSSWDCYGMSAEIMESRQGLGTALGGVERIEGEACIFPLERSHPQVMLCKAQRGKYIYILGTLPAFTQTGTAPLHIYILLGSPGSIASIFILLLGNHSLITPIYISISSFLASIAPLYIFISIYLPYG